MPVAALVNASRQQSSKRAAAPHRDLQGFLSSPPATGAFPAAAAAERRYVERTGVMTLAGKGSRRIEIDSVRYRWTVAANDEPGLGIVVQHATSKGQRLVSWVAHGVVVSPGLVRRAILDGLASGWRPDERGVDLVRRVPEFSEVRAAAHQCPACDYFSLTTRGQYDICPVCFWEDSGQDLGQLDAHSGPNHLTLREARANFLSFGACHLSVKQSVVDGRLR